MSSTVPYILIIDDDTEIRYSLERVLTSRGYQVITASSGEDGLKQAQSATPAVIFLDNRMEGISGLETLQHMRSISPNSMIILMTAFGTTQTAIEAMKFGAFDYIIKPFDVKKVLALTEGALKAHLDLTQSKDTYQPLIDSDDFKEGIVGNSEPMQQVFKVIGQVAASDVTVMITGESGTGKELIARAIYQHSHRNQGPFIAVNCAAIPDNLIESELFGHEKGSFTGATNQRRGKFELCDGGTIFLDEIGDMALPTQTKILRALQEGEIQRVGGTETIKVDVRLIAATNKDLESMVEEKTFREDLYYRLNVMRIRLPALRERRGDIPQLVDFMLQRMAKERKSRVKQLSSEAMDLLLNYDWPGNVRELENIIQRCAVVAQGETVLTKDLPQEIQAAVKSTTPAAESDSDTDTPEEEPEWIGRNVEPPQPTRKPGDPTTPPIPLPPAASGTFRTGSGGLNGTSALSLEDTYDMLYSRLRDSDATAILQVIEQAMIERVLKETGGNQVKASNILGITRATLRKRIDQYQLRY